MLYLDMCHSSMNGSKVQISGRTDENLVSAPQTRHSLTSGRVSTIYLTQTPFKSLYSILFTDPTALPRSPVPSSAVVHPSGRTISHYSGSVTDHCFPNMGTNTTNKTSTQTTGYLNNDNVHVENTVLGCFVGSSSSLFFSTNPLTDKYHEDVEMVTLQSIPQFKIR